MNKVNLIGRLTKDPELRYNQNNIEVTRFTLAVNRSFLNANGEREADFISCVAWRKTAEIICKHFKKGSELGVSGRIQTGSYDKEDGSKVYTTDIIVEEITFIGSKKESRPDPEYTGPQNDEVTPASFEANNEDKKGLSDDVFAEFGEQIEIDESDLAF